MGLAIAVNTALQTIPSGTPVASGKPLYADSFGGGDAATVLGRLTDAGPGLTRGTWVGVDKGVAISGGKLVRGTVDATWSALLPTTATSMSISFILNARPTVSAIYVDILRATITGSPNSYRLEVGDGSIRIMKRFGGPNTYLSPSISVPMGSRLALRKRGSLIEVTVDGVLRESVTDTDITTGAYAGLAASTAATGFVIDDLRVSTY